VHMISSVLTILVLALSLVQPIEALAAAQANQKELLAPFLEALQDDGETQRPPDVIPPFPAPYGDPNMKHEVPKQL